MHRIKAHSYDKGMTAADFDAMLRTAPPYRDKIPIWVAALRETLVRLPWLPELPRGELGLNLRTVVLGVISTANYHRTTRKGNRGIGFVSRGEMGCPTGLKPATSEVTILYLSS